MQHKAVFTGGGSAGHVTPNLALMKALQAEGWQISYIGTADGIERSLLLKMEDIPYYSIPAGKLRRYFSLKNISDLFRVLRGVRQARGIIRKLQPELVFCKGGFVSVPVVLGARGCCHIVAHESDYTPGLSNRIANKYADKICVTFEDTLKHTGKKGVFTGTPIRPELYAGEAALGFAFTGFSLGKPVLLVMGGSLGAEALNQALRAALPSLLVQFQIIHLCGKGKVSEAAAQPGYVQYEYIDAELPHLLAMADLVLSRAGANAVFEFLALKKPMLLIPLPLSASRGDQIQNAAYFEKRGYASVLQQEEMTPQSLADALTALYQNHDKYRAAMQAAPNADGTQAVLDVIRECVEGVFQ